VMTVTSESPKGACKGTATIQVLGYTESVTAKGTVNKKGQCSVHFSAHNFSSTVTGTATTSLITGKFNLAYTIMGHHRASHGTFSLSR